MIAVPRKLVGVLALICSLPGAASAQPADAPSSGAIRLGVVALDPRLRVTQIGVDTNVFNTAENPQRDASVSVNASILPVASKPTS